MANVRTPHATSLVLAAAILLSVLAPLVPVVEAQGVVTNDLQIATGPFFATRPAKEGAAATTDHYVAANKTTGVQLRVIEVYNPKSTLTPASSDNDIHKVTFTYVAGTHPIEWDGDAASLQTDDWSAASSNGDPSRTLIFSGGSIAPGATERFTIAFKVDPNAVGDSPLPANQESFNVAVKAETIAGDTMTTNPAANSFRIVIDNTKPKLLGATTRDENFDGKLDRIQLDFSEPIDPNTFFRQDFIVRDTSVSPNVDYIVSGFGLPQVGRAAFTAGGVFTLLHTGGTTGAGAVMPSSPEPIAGEKIAFLVLTPRGPYDTGAVPQVYYDSPTAVRANFNLTDLAKNKLAVTYSNDSAIQEIDGAKPVMVGTTGVVGGTTVSLVFSEEVHGTSSGNAVQKADLEYTDGLVAANNIDDLATDFGAVQHTVGPGTGRLVKLVTVNPTVLGTGDVCDFPAATCDTFSLALSTSPPTSCTVPDFIPCTTRIKDASAGHLTSVTLGGSINPLSIQAPHVALKAQVNNDANKVTVDFTVPVSDASGDGIPVALSAFDVVAADGTGQGPGGVILAQQVDGKQIILTLDKKTRPTDLDDTPARIRIRCGAIKVTGLTDSFIPCADPDADGRPDVDMEDRTRPAIRELHSVDGNRDGYLDAVFLIMNEPVDDASFCMSLLPNPGTPPPARTFQIPASCDKANPDVVLELDTVCGPYTWETNVEGVLDETLAGLDIAQDPDNQKNDRFGLIKFPQANSCTPVGPLPSDFIPAIRTRSEGLFSDLSQFTPVSNVRKMVPICEGKGLPNNDCGKWTNGIDNYPLDGECPVGAPSTCPEDPREFDRAPPVIWSARTVDDFPRVPSLPETAWEGNGLLDGYLLHFSEPVDDSSFRAADWSIAGHTATGLRTAPLATDLAERPPIALCGITQSYKNDCEVIVTFNEANRTVAPDGDTEVTPQLTYRHAGGVGGFRDLDGVDMRIVETTTVNELDGAKPVIFRAEAMAGKAKTRITWSEPVDNGARGGLVRNDLTYSNVNGRDVSGMADQSAVQSIPGDRSTYVTMIQAMTADDIAKDCIAADLNAVFEVAPRVPIALKQVASVACHRWINATDIEPPAAIADLSVVTSLSTANSLTLTFTAPGDDGADFGTVSHYQVRVARSSFNFTTFSELPSSEDALVRTDGLTVPADFDDYTLKATPTPLGTHGTTQQITVIGLAPTSTFYLAIRAIDDAGQASFPSMVVSGTTGKDTTPPGVPVPAATVARNGVTANRTVTFSWDPVIDPDSTVRYRYAINDVAEYSVGPNDSSTAQESVVFAKLSSGAYVFHVAAVSAGGVSATAHYPFRVGFEEVPEATIKLFNGRIQATFERDGKTNTITWTLPAKDSLPSAAPLEAVRIVRLDGTTFREVYLKKGTYEALASGSYADTTGNATSQYRVEMVFAENQAQATDSLTPKFTKVSDVTAHPFQLGLVLAIAAAVLVAGLVVGVWLYLRRGGAAGGTTPPAGTDAQSGLPTHDVECPNCKTPFQAVGALPLQIHCPKCGVTGVLQ